ncbi:hypothetical protein ACFQ5F_08165 [Kroppenstedtia eburnea]|uniref:hypothetical protein n=1 Tax=Kroppenstedtia eburnea TaxID=714067 RepID=UPI00362BABFC
MSQKFEPPKEVVTQALRYKRPGERYEIFDTRVEYNNELYYYVAYFKGKKIIADLIVREDGIVPSLSDPDTVKVLRISIGVNTKMRHFIILGSRWSYTVDQVWRDQEKLLTKMYQKHEREMPEEVKNHFQKFIEVPRGILKGYKVIQESCQRAKQLRKKMERRGDVTDQAIDEELDQARDKMFYAKNKQHLLALNSEESRKRVIHFLAKKIPLWDLQGRWRLQKIKSLHRRMRFNKRERQDVLDVQDDVTRSKVGEEEFQKILEVTRNQR